jgi:hypothetical protein
MVVLLWKIKGLKPTSLYALSNTFYSCQIITSHTEHGRKNTVEILKLIAPWYRVDFSATRIVQLWLVSVQSPSAHSRASVVVCYRYRGLIACRSAPRVCIAMIIVSQLIPAFSTSNNALCIVVTNNVAGKYVAPFYGNMCLDNHASQDTHVV